MSLSKLLDVPDGTEDKVARMWLIPLDAATAQPIPGFEPMRLQYWPETITLDRGTVGWQTKEVPGMGALLSWSSNGLPTLSFELELTADTDPAYLLVDDKIAYPDDRNVDINAGLAWLTACTNPDIAVINGVRQVKPPPVIQIVAEYLPPDGLDASYATEIAPALGGVLNSTVNALESLDRAVSVSAPNSRSRGLTLSQTTQDFYGVLSSLNTTYVQSFPSGLPRIARVSLSFIETIQLGDLIIPQTRARNLEIARVYNLLDNAASLPPLGD